jgi:hypothetical protein
MFAVVERTVTFSAPMVLALLQGRKTQTRRLATSPLRRCEVGDRLIVREHWKTLAMHDKWSPTVLGDRYRASAYPGKERASPVLYLADQARRGAWPERQTEGWSPGKHRQAMHMPKWASRMSLVITGVRVEPLQAISDADCIAEGPKVKGYADFGSFSALNGVMVETEHAHVSATPRNWYRNLWDTLHQPPHAWDDNPEVLVLTFDVHYTAPGQSS